MNRDAIFQKLLIESLKSYHSKQYPKALECWRLASKINPSDPFLSFAKVAYLIEFRRFNEALECLNHILNVSVPNSRVYHELGKVLFWLFKFDDALLAIRKSSNLSRDLPSGNLEERSLYITANFEIEKHISNICELRMLSLDPLDISSDPTSCEIIQAGGSKRSYAKTYCVLALAAHWNKDYKLSTHLNHCSVNFYPTADVYSNLAINHFNMHQGDLAQKYALKSIEEGGGSTCKCLAGLVFLKDKKFTKGWELLESRESRLDRQAHCSVLKEAKLWKGEPLNNQTILITAEEGYGDIIQYSRFLHLLGKWNPKKIIFASREAQMSLYKYNFPNITIKGVNELLEGGIEYDKYFTNSSFPKIFNLTDQSIPFREGYLKAPKDSLAAISPYIKQSGRLKVGFCWEVSYERAESYNRRRIPLEFFLNLTSIQGIDFYSIQQGIQEKALRPHVKKNRITLLGKRLETFADTFAAADSMDLIITPDSSLLHIAGSLGIPHWVILPKQRDCRWFDYDLKSPWYQSGRLFNQKYDDEWKNPFDEVFARLEEVSKYHLLKDLKNRNKKILFDSRAVCILT